jgi:hypothetical protein
MESKFEATIEGEGYTEIAEKLAALNDKHLIVKLVVVDKHPTYNAEDFPDLIKEWVPKLADELANFSMLCALTVSFPHNLVDWECFQYLAAKINGLASLAEIEVRLPKGAKKESEEHNWTSTLKAKPRIVERED